MRARLSGGSEPRLAQLVSPSVSLMPHGARNPPWHGWKCARLGWASRRRGPFPWEEPRWWWGALLPARWCSAGAEQSQDETLLCRPVRISGFLCLCLDFQRLNWASAAKGLQPRGQGYCLFLWLSPRATPTGRRTDINTAFVALWMLLLLSWTISYSLLSDFSSFSERCMFSLSWRGGKCLENRMREPICIKWPDACRVLLFPLFFFLSEQRGCGHGRHRSGNASQLLQRGWKFFLGKRCWELCVFSLLSREFIMKFIRWDLWLR